MADFGSTELNIGGSASLSSTFTNEIEASVMAALSAGIVANYGADSVSMSEFNVVSGDTYKLQTTKVVHLLLSISVVTMET